MIRVQRQSDGRVFSFEAADLLTKPGGEGAPYRVRSEPGLIAKVYHPQNVTPERAAKLRAMMARPPSDPGGVSGHASIAWPLDLLLEPDGARRIVGFLMPRVRSTAKAIDLYTPKARRAKCPLFSYRYLLRTARNLSGAVAALHRAGYVIGDVNESNILVSDSALVTLVDTDSFQVPGPNGRVFRCPVCRPEYTPPELRGKDLRRTDRRPEHDAFGLAVVLFQLLMEGTHPFAGRYTGSGEPPPLEDRIARGLFPHGSRSGPCRPPKLAPPFGMLHPEVRRLFVRCFEEGHRHPARRPTAQEWHDILGTAERELVCCRTNGQHWYGRHLSACPWCQRKRQLHNYDSFPPKAPAPARPARPAQAPLPPLGGFRAANPVPSAAPPRAVAPPAPAGRGLPGLPSGAGPATARLLGRGGKMVWRRFLAAFGRPRTGRRRPAAAYAWAGAMLLLALIGGASPRLPWALLLSFICGVQAWRAGRARPVPERGAAVVALLGVACAVLPRIGFVPAPRLPHAPPPAKAVPTPAAPRPVAEAHRLVNGAVTQLVDLQERQERGELSRASATERRRALQADLERARRLSQEAIQKDRRDPDAWLESARASYYLGRYDEAMGTVRQATVLFPDSPDFGPLEALIERGRRRQAAQGGAL